MAESIFIDRPPRIQPELPFETVEIPSPPQPPEKGIMRLLEVGLPMIAILGSVFMTMGLGASGRSALLVIPMLLSVVGSAGLGIFMYVRERSDQVKAERAYAERLVELTKEMQAYQDLQRRFYSYNYPDPAGVWRTVRDARIEVEKERRTLRADARLWERRTDDDDFGVVRLGMGTLPSTVVFTLRDRENVDNAQMRAALKLHERSRFVSDIPVIVSLRQAPKKARDHEREEQPGTSSSKQEEEMPATPMTHALGVAGEPRSVYEFTRSLLAGFVAFHAPMDARLYILAGRKEQWTWTDNVPHCQDDETMQYRFFVDEPQSEASQQRDDEESPLVHYLEGIRKVLSQRRLQLEESEEETKGRSDPTLPFCLLLVDRLDTAYDDESPLNDLEGDAAISILLEDGARLGAAVIFLLPERSKLPSGCTSILEIEKTTPATNARSPELQRLHFRFGETGINSCRYVGEADFVRSLEEMNDLAARLAALDVRRSFGAGIQSSVPFMRLMGYETMTQLEKDAWHRWQETAKSGHADWLRARLGLMSGNKPRTLVFSAKRDGVHGMVAGSTGSGKSELLISLITGMAVTYHPSTLNFVLVDYKGGGAFKGFEALPHCVDIITNLGSEGVTRMFTAINAELQRRQKLNADTNTKNIVDYRQRDLHRTHTPYPFLFIIIDEFAEMISDRAEFKAQLETITRVGRAQGVSLILAAQRPSGVTDQMRSNIKFRICLRVETAAESRELLRRTDAAFLPGGIPGRGYLQVGNEEIELIQVAYAGDKYVSPNHRPRVPVVWPDRGGIYDPRSDQEPPELFRAIVTTLNDLARTHDMPKQSAPWPGFLPLRLSLSTVLVSHDPGVAGITSERYLSPQDVAHILLDQPSDPILSLNAAVSRWLNDGHGWVEQIDWTRRALRPVVGLVDNPYSALQHPLTVNLPRGHAIVFGASGWGKTTFLRTLAVSLAATHSPDYLHLYILDLGGRSLSMLDRLPHTGAVINPDEEGYQERVEQLLRELDDIIDRRKTALGTAGLPDIYKYNEQHATDPLAAMVVLLDNFTEFKETFGGDQEDVETPLDKLIQLAREGKPYGLHFVLTAQSVAALPGNMFNLFTERFTLKLADSGEYRAVLGAAADEIADIPGRGYIRAERLPLSFQVAVPLDLDRAGGAVNENREIERLASNMHDYMARSKHHYSEPVRIGALPKAVLFKQILARMHNLALDESFVARLADVTRHAWTTSRSTEETDWLNVTIGLVSGNRLRRLEFEAKKDGVHGLIAGGTGSGKSELLMTLICGLALNYDPSILNFVLVDYKGGGAFKPFENLPHCVDTITNLNKAAVRRMFTAINAEMMRRQKLNADTGTKDIVEYRAKGFHLTREPYPHLFIIIDEYAEMITDSPEFKAELDSITRVGRSAGVSLLLAAQRPTGVTDQMRANIKFRICLRVEGTDTSREMLRRSDAAFLPNGVPGRGYLQVGNESIELMQIAYTGENYPYAQVVEGSQALKFYDVVVDLANRLLSEAEAARPRTPWPPFLPRGLTFPDPLIQDYIDRSYVPLMTLGMPNVPLSLNPFLEGWLAGHSGWPSVDWSRQALRGIVGLLDDPSNARQLPLVIDLNKGHVVVFGASGYGKTTFLRSLAISLAATHSPDELHIHVMDMGGRNLEVLRALPQVGTVIMPDERGYEERVQQLLRELVDLVDVRKRMFAEAGVSTLPEYNRTRPDRLLPAVLLMMDNFGEFIETFGGEGQEKEESNQLNHFVALLRQCKAYGVHVVISALRLSVLSTKLLSLFTERLSLRLAEADDYSQILGARVDEVEEIQGRGCMRVDRQPLTFQIALPPGTLDSAGQVRGESAQIRAIGAQMQHFLSAADHVYQEPLHIDALPKTSSYRQVLAEEFRFSANQPYLEALYTAATRQWQHNASAEHADWLRVTMGVISGNRKRTLQLEAKRDGVHGLVAGGTGSGKSELLMTMVVGLALNYSPEILNFVLVDYKGGGAFKPFDRLPHVVDIVTNLNKAGVDRMFTAISAEIRRRQRLNAETGTKDIVEYRRRGLHLSGEPYSHLFIIIDEYSEMIDDNPEYKEQLESITRVGRSQGINLVLASQRPKGVTDQMRANIKFRICLRVEQTDASSEMLRRPDAAYLPNGMPGRGYLQVGNEGLELIQISYTGEAQPDDRELPVLWPDRASSISSAMVRSADDALRLFDAAVLIASELRNGQMARRPWPPFLPTRLTLQSPIFDSQHQRWWVLNQAVTDWLNDEPEGLWCVNWQDGVLRVTVGLVDDPAEARQFPLEFNLSRYHLLAFGDTGWGRTSLLRSIAVGLATTHSPDDLHVYIVDMGGRSFRTMEALPHVGTVLYADDDTFEERMDRLFTLIQRTVDERMQIFSSTGVSNLHEFNARFPDRRLPALLVVIDNFAPLMESYEGFVEVVLTPLLRRCLPAGVVFLVTANAPNNVPLRLSALFGERITFKQNNADFYLDIVGRGALEIDDIPGRGYIRADKRPLLFQTALPVGIEGSPGLRDTRLEADELHLLAHNMQAYLASGAHTWRNHPDGIPILPDIVSLAQLLEQAPQPQSRRVEAVIGLNENLEPALLDLRRVAPHLMVVGSPLSGKTTALYTYVLSLADRYPPDQVSMVFIDLQRRLMDYGGKRRLDDLPHVLASISEIEECMALVRNLMAEGSKLVEDDLKREIFVFIDNFDDFGEEATRFSGLDDDLALLARRYGRDGLHFVVAGGPEFGSSELRRRVMAANLGIGLRNAAAVDALRVNRTPPALQGGNRELGLGRGFRVRSGQAGLLQLATPYEHISYSDGDHSVDEEERKAQALDAWVDRILARYPDEKAEWSIALELPDEDVGEDYGDRGAVDDDALVRADLVSPSSRGLSRPSTSLAGRTSVQEGIAARLAALLPHAVAWEIANADENGEALILSPALDALDAARRSNPSYVLPLLRQLYRRIQQSFGLPDEIVDQMMDTVKDDEMLLVMLDSLVSETDAMPELDSLAAVSPTGDSPEERAGFIFNTFSDKDLEVSQTAPAMDAGTPEVAAGFVFTTFDVTHPPSADNELRIEPDESRQAGAGHNGADDAPAPDQKRRARSRQK